MSRLVVPSLLFIALQLLVGCRAVTSRCKNHREASILSLLQAELGIEWRLSTEALISNTSDIWQAMYKTLPKNGQGTVDA
eukprot:CAMPEP_0115700678 /NCGR_PEP_ID=MMETSP0272-20121206/67542_1 /TAXON_ID=71861 /ORGANISM="Scrippsiella trochoidea, Strain CCMP3099" /LENGTH=79 /DNA_ID=CAMNT_0003141189 /DNA_START=47 /DNA_END=283 /DNA_ORIENTATION=+